MLNILVFFWVGCWGSQQWHCQVLCGLSAPYWNHRFLSRCVDSILVNVGLRQMLREQPSMVGSIRLGMKGQFNSTFITWIPNIFDILMTIHQDSLADSLGFTKLLRSYQVIAFILLFLNFIPKRVLSVCRNLSGHFILCGIGAARASNGTFYLTQLFAAWESYKIWKSFEGWQVSNLMFMNVRQFDVFLRASMFHVLEELFDFKLWEFARGREGKPSPRVSQPSPSFLHYVFNFGLLDLLGESFRKLRCRVQVTRAAITMHTSAKSQKLCAAKSQCVNILIFCIFEIFWYDFPNGKAIVLQSCLAESRSLLCF